MVRALCRLYGRVLVDVVGGDADFPLDGSPGSRHRGHGQVLLIEGVPAKEYHPKHTCVTILSLS